MLPPSIPSSLPPTDLGGIEYHLQASIQGFTDKTTVMNLTVLSNPVTTPESLSAPMTINNEKFVGLINGKRLSMKCHLPQTGWNLGSTMPIKVSIENDSKKFMVLKCLLKQEISYIFDATHKRVVSSKIAFADGPQIEPRTNVEHTLPLQVPANLPIIQNICPLIQISYVISVKLDIPGSFDLQTKLPIILTQTMAPTHGAPAPGMGVAPAHPPYPAHGYIPATMTPPPSYGPPVTNSSAPPPPGMISMTNAPAYSSAPSTVPSTTAPYPTLDYGMPQPAYNPHVPVADEAVHMPPALPSVPPTVQYPQLN